MWMDSYVQETLLHQHMADIERRAERARLLRADAPPVRPMSLVARVSQLLRLRLRSAPRLVPQLRSR